MQTHAPEDRFAAFNTHGKQPRPARAQQTQHDITRQLERAKDIVGKMRRKDRLVIPKDHLRHRGREHRCNHDGHECLERKISQQDFKRKEHTRDGRVKDARDPRSSAAPKQGDHMPSRHSQPTRDHRTRHRSNLYDGTFRTARAAGADCANRRDDFDHPSLRRDRAAFANNRIEHLRHTMPSCFAREEIHNQSSQQRTNHRDQRDQPPATVHPC